MKILFISHEYPPVGGGGANACQNLARCLAERGNTVHIVTVSSPGAPALEYMYDDRCVIYRLKTNRKANDHSTAPEMLDYIRKAEPLLMKMASRENYDVCLTFFGLPSGPLAQRLKSKHGLPYVIRFGGGDIPGFQDRFGILYTMLSPELKSIWKHADGLVANSSGLRKTALEFCDDYPIQVIPNGVDTDMFRPDTDTSISDNNAPDSGVIRLLTVCRLIERKGLQDVIPRLTDITEKTGREIRWTVAGDGPFRAELEKLAANSGTLQFVDFVGEKTKEELAGIYRQADLFVYPSYREGMPNVVLEAMASGLPVIMRKSCQGAEELIRDNGVAAEGDFTDALCGMISMGHEKMAAMGSRSRQIVLEEFTCDAIADKYEELLRSITG